MEKICTIVGSDKGGVGKSMISLIMTLVFDNAQFPLSVIEIDNQRKLTSVLGANRVDLSIAAAPDLRELSRNRHLAESYYNPVYLEWVKGHSITDLGANVTTSLMSWFKQCEIGELAAEDGLNFRFVACASPDEQAIRSALMAVEESREALGGAAEYFVVLNDLFGTTGFAPYENHPAMRELRALEHAGEVTLLDVRYCDSLLLDHGKALGLNPLEAVRRADEVAAAANLDQVATRVAKSKMLKWLQDLQQSIEPLLVAPQPVRQPYPAQSFRN